MSVQVKRNESYQRIATEEAWAPTELLDRYRTVLEKRTIDDPGFHSLWGFYLSSTSERATRLRERLQYLDERRIADMDQTGIDRQLLLLTSPGVQVFDAPTATALARSSNDQLAAACRKFPERLSGLAAIAPQDPPGAAKELERGIRQLGLKGAVINSHTLGEYLDNPKFWDIFAAAEALDAPIYIHPNTPSRGLIGPLLERGLDGAIYGFGVDTGMHILGLITSGVFDRFPRLKIVVGHLGEALPFWMFRIDYMHAATVRSKRYDFMQPLKRKPSDYMKENIYITTSGMAWEPAILFCRSVLGASQVLYAMDYPYQFEGAEVQMYDQLPLTTAEKKQLMQGNAEQLFKLRTAT